MGILKKILLGIVMLIVLLVVIGVFLPRTAHVERSTVIDAPICTVFTLVNGYGRFNEWSPWAKRDPNTKYTFEGPDFGVGAKMSWASDDRNVGSGSQEIVASKPFELVGSKLDFGEHGTADAFFRLSEEGQGTKVVWGFDSDAGWNLIGRYFGLAMDSMLGKDYEDGLASLKQLAEGLPKTDWCDSGAEVVDAKPIKIAWVSGSSSTDPAAIGAALGASYGEVGAFLGQHGLEQAGPPISITTKWDEAGGMFAYEAAIPVAGMPAGEIRADSPVKLGPTYEGKAIKVVHKGPYENLPGAYEQITAYAAVHGLELGERPWEEYVSDPGNTPQEELITNVYFPVK